MTPPEISVIIPLYREFQWLEKALRSIQENSFQGWEAILVNDGSPEDPKPILDPFLKDTRFHYVEKVHGGSASARNFGLRSARAEWIAFLDQDDCILPARFASQLAYAKEMGEGIAGIYSDYERIDETGKILDRYVSRAVSPSRFVQESLARRGLVAIGTALIRKKWIDQVAGFDSELSGYEETDLVVRIALSGGAFSYLAGLVYQWRNHVSNTMKSPKFQEEQRLRFVAKLRRLSEQYPALKDCFSEFQARSWYKIGLYHAEAGEWGLARKWCWKAWQEDPGQWPALYLAAKSWFKWMI